MFHFHTEEHPLIFLNMSSTLHTNHRFMSWLINVLITKKLFVRQQEALPALNWEIVKKLFCLLTTVTLLNIGEHIRLSVPMHIISPANAFYAKTDRFLVILLHIFFTVPTIHWNIFSRFSFLLTKRCSLDHNRPNHLWIFTIHLILVLFHWQL